MKKLTVNESLKIAMHNRDMKIHDLECENLELRVELERLREMVVALTSGGVVFACDPGQWDFQADGKVCVVTTKDETTVLASAVTAE